MSWGDLFDRAADVDATVDAVRRALSDRHERETAEGREENGSAES